MIFIDVTAACLLPLQSGIPRTTRGLYRLLEDEAPRITPIFWQPFRRCYTRLSTRARALLENPFADADRPVPRDSTWPLLRASLSDLRFWPSAVPLPRDLRTGDTLLLTSLFPDNRLGYLHRLMEKPGRKIAIFHDAIPLRDPNVPAWEKKRHIETLRLLARFDLLIAVSHAAEADLRAAWSEYGIAPGSTTVLPWPVPFFGPRPEFTEPAGKPERVLYVSRLKLMKNHATLFTACEKLWREGVIFELELIGCEDEARESRVIVEEIARLKREGRAIFWRGHVSEEALHEAYRRAAFTVFPSRMEGFGLPIVESFWHGRAVICGDRDAVGELARNGGCLTVEVRSADALATVMRELLQDEVRRRALAREAYARPLRTWADYGRELLPLLDAS
jgi:glycosyltransferase involved in cell wall biosynthesis